MLTFMILVNEFHVRLRFSLNFHQNAKFQNCHRHKKPKGYPKASL